MNSFPATQPATAHPDVAPRSLDVHTLALLALIIAVGAGLRLYGLDRESLWNDELSGWHSSSLETWSEVVAYGIPPNHPPGHAVLQHFWIRSVGDSESLLRLPSAVAGILVIPAMFALGRRLYGERDGLIAATLTAVLWMPVFYSQEARANMLMLLMVVLSSCWLIDIARASWLARPLPRIGLLGYVFCALLACYLHYFGLFFVGLQAALMTAIFLRRKPALLRLAGIYAVIGVGYSPWFLRGAAAMLAGGGPGYLNRPQPGDIWRFLKFLFNQSDTLAWVVLMLWGSLVGRAVWAARRHPRDIKRGLSPATALLAIWLIVPFALVYLYSFVAVPVVSDRSLIILAPAAYLLVARAISPWAVRQAVMSAVVVGLSVALLFHLVIRRDYFTSPRKEQFRDAAAYLVEHDRAGVRAVILACAWDRSYFDYYLKRMGSRRRVDAVACTSADVAPLARLVSERLPEELWLLAGHREAQPELMAYLTNRMRVIDEAHFRRADVWRFVSR